MTAIRNESSAGDATPPVSELAVAVAGATDYADLMRRVGACLRIDAADGGTARLWRLRGDVQEQCVTYPADADFERPDPTCLATAAADGWTTVGDAGLIGLRGDEGPIGVLEVRPASLVDPDLREPLAQLVGARLNGLARAYEYRERMPHVSLADDAQEIEDVMTAFAAQAKLMLDHDRLSVYLLSPDGTAFERFAVATSPILPGESEVIPVEQVGLTRVVRANESLVSGDFGVDDRILGLEDSVIARAGFHGLVSVPLRLGGKPFGLLNFVSKTPNFYSEADIGVAQQTADDIAVFLQYLRMQRAMRAAVQREAVAEERNRVAREFHDTLAQTLSQIAIKAASLADEATSDALSATLTTMRELSQHALDQGRRSLQDLLPSQLEERTLSEAIRAELGRLETDDGLASSLIATGAVDELPTRVEVAVFRIFTEAITNVLRHADATAVSVELHVDSDLRMTIRDNGRGITHGATTSTHTGFGIETMRDRARALGGRLLVSAAVGPGTEVFLQLPEIGARPTVRRGSVESAAPPPTTVTRVVLVDDHPAFREGICQVLSREQGLRVVGEAGTAAEALALVRSRRPDVVLLDLDLPDSTGVDMANRVQEIKEIAPAAVVVVMSAFADDADITAALEAGVAGFVAKSSSPSTVIDVIRSAINGATVVTSPGRPRGAVGRDASFTSRELEVLRGIASGKTNAEIGRELYLADKTVERIVATIANKLGAKNRAHAVALGVVSRLVDVRNL